MAAKCNKSENEKFLKVSMEVVNSCTKLELNSEVRDCRNNPSEQEVDAIQT